MQNRPLGTSGFSIAPLVFGGNVFGWTVDRERAFALLDRFFEAGFNCIDTADVYCAWVEGKQGGESETIIGDWLAARPERRKEAVIISKGGVNLATGKMDLSADYITRAVEASLRRLRVERIDLYLSHWPDSTTPVEETLRAYERLIEQGKIAAIGSSNIDAAQIREALAISDREGLPRYVLHQPEFNLHDRDGFGPELQQLCLDEGLGVVSYYSLASGFLTGKYRSEADLSKSPRGRDVAKYLTPRGFRILDALEEVAGELAAKPAEVALAWVTAYPGMTAPVASASTLEQLESLIRAASLKLPLEAFERLDQASRHGRE